MPWRTSNAKSLLPPPFAKCCMWSAKMFVQALRVEWQPDPESLRTIRRYGPNRARSEVVDYPRVKNRSNRSHRIARVVHNHFCRHQETGNKKNRQPCIRWTVDVSNWRIVSLPALASHIRGLSLTSMAPWRLHRQVAVSDYGQLLMLKTI